MWEFEDVLEEARVFGPELLHAARREILPVIVNYPLEINQQFFPDAINSNLDITPYGLRSVPTHTEDGIPIRKVYISNLAPKTTRMELFGVFAQYGFIKSCWVRMGGRGPNRAATPTYAFVTFSDPADAHKALLAPEYEKTLRGFKLKTFPADSWHQPAEDADGHVLWKPRGPRQAGKTHESNRVEEVEPAVESASDSNEDGNIVTEETQPTEKTYTILDILNSDCMAHLLSFIPIIDLIKSERVSKRWQNMIHEYLNGIRKFKTSWWHHGTVTLTTAVLRRVLQRLGPSLTKLHIDHHWSALNDRTAHTIGKFCPNLEELKVVGMYTKNWNPLVYGCKNLRTLSFVSCNKLSDSSLVRIMQSDAEIESVTVANNTHVTGLFLTGCSSERLHTLAFYNCYSLQGTVLSAAIDSLPNLKTLRLDVCPVTMWKLVPLILNKLPRLTELSLSEYTSMDFCMTPQVNLDFIDALSRLTELRSLNLSRNIYISNAVLKQVAQTCTKLESLNISSCNSRKSNPQPGVSDEGIHTICRACTQLQRLDISYLAQLTDAGVGAVAGCPRLQLLTARGNASLTTAAFGTVIETCPVLKEIDLCGCDSVSEELVSAAIAVLTKTDPPRTILLRLGGTAAVLADNIPAHRQVRVELDEDLSNPHLRPDFVDRIFDDSSDDSLDDPFDIDHFDDFLGSDEEIFLNDELDYDDALYAYGIHAQNLLLL